MAKTERDPETGLRIYNPHKTSIAWTRSDMHAAQRNEADYFVRGTKVITQGGKFACLGALLDQADEAFEKVAVDAGASVVEHTWALTPTPQNSYGKPMFEHGLVHPLLPRGLSLVARVEVVRVIAPVLPAEHVERVTNAINLHQEAELPIKWADCGVQQFAYGIGPDDSSHDLKLIDIDPKLVDPKTLSSSIQRLIPKSYV